MTTLRRQRKDFPDMESEYVRKAQKHYCMLLWIAHDSDESDLKQYC